MQCGAEARAAGLAGWRLRTQRRWGWDRRRRTKFRGWCWSGWSFRLWIGGSGARRNGPLPALDWAGPDREQGQASKASKQAAKHTEQSREQCSAVQCRAEQGRCNFVCASGVRASALFRRAGGVAVVYSYEYSGRALRPTGGAWSVERGRGC